MTPKIGDRIKMHKALTSGAVIGTIVTPMEDDEYWLNSKETVFTIRFDGEYYDTPDDYHYIDIKRFSLLSPLEHLL